MIRVEKLTKLYNKIPAVSDISFTIKKGQNMVLLGTSGCGKTTTLKMINDLIHPDSGEVWLDEVSTRKMKPEVYRKKTGYVLQNIALFPHFTIAENIAVVPRLLGWDKDKIRRRCLELLEKLHLSPDKHYSIYPHQLSGGQQQRVGLARALAAEPSILLMDEPFGALDPITRASIKKDIAQLDEFKDKTIVLVTHDVQEAFELGDIICLMDKGEIIQQGNPEELLFKPASAFVSGFFKEQQLLLEYQNTTLHKLFRWLPETHTFVQNLISVSPDEKLWQAFEKLNTAGKSLLVIKDSGGRQKYADHGALLHAFTTYKNTIA
ncbi:ABC transporter ATP-binding protein [Arcticibacter svalbardensis]|nr:ABC transporter ATP-binding protein [Arcticibacter svalbardensis]